MTLFFDHDLSYRPCDRLSDLFPGSTNADREGMATAEDSAIWRFAAAEGYVIVTRDADFPAMAALLGSPPPVVWLRNGNSSTATTEAFIRGRAVEIAEWLSQEGTTVLELM